MGIKKNNPGCGCCDESDCAACEFNGKRPNGIELTLSGFPSTIYIARPGPDGCGSDPFTCDTTPPSGSYLYRYKIDGLDTLFNDTFTEMAELGNVPIAGSCNILAIINGSFSATLERATEIGVVGPDGNYLCPDEPFVYCRNVTFNYKLVFSFIGFDLSLSDATFPKLLAVIGGALDFGYCTEDTDSVLVTFFQIGRKGGPFDGICSAWEACGTASSFTLTYTIGPLFP